MSELNPVVIPGSSPCDLGDEKGAILRLLQERIALSKEGLKSGIWEDIIKNGENLI